MAYMVARAVSHIWLQAHRIGDFRGFINNPIRLLLLLHGFFDSKTRSRISGEEHCMRHWSGEAFTITPMLPTRARIKNLLF